MSVHTIDMYGSFRLQYWESEGGTRMFVIMKLMTTCGQHGLLGEYLCDPSDFDACKHYVHFDFAFQ
jgi:hypothetical protein